MSDRWAEYNAGTLTPPVVVQHDTLYAGTAKEEHLVWLYTAAGIIEASGRTATEEG